MHTPILYCIWSNPQYFMNLAYIEPFLSIRGSIVASISACHAEDPGSIPGLGVFMHMSLASYLHTHIRPPTHTSTTAHFFHVTPHTHLHVSHSPHASPHTHVPHITHIPHTNTTTTAAPLATSSQPPTPPSSLLTSLSIPSATSQHIPCYIYNTHTHTHRRHHASNIPRTPSTSTHLLITPHTHTRTQPLAITHTLRSPTVSAPTHNTL